MNAHAPHLLPPNRVLYPWASEPGDAASDVAQEVRDHEVTCPYFGHRTRAPHDEQGIRASP